LRGAQPHRRRRVRGTAPKRPALIGPERPYDFANMSCCCMEIGERYWRRGETRAGREAVVRRRSGVEELLSQRAPRLLGWGPMIGEIGEGSLYHNGELPQMRLMVDKRERAPDQVSRPCFGSGRSFTPSRTFRKETDRSVILRYVEDAQDLERSGSRHDRRSLRSLWREGTTAEWSRDRSRHAHLERGT
jgi:hypothetical protein